MGNDFRRRLGMLGEATATRFISEAGLQVVDRNWRNGRAGELDIIATDGSNTIVIEVRTRFGNAKGSALESVDDRKVRQLRSLSVAWARSHECRGRVRVDIVAITVDPAMRVVVEETGPDADLRDYGAHIAWIRGIA